MAITEVTHTRSTESRGKGLHIGLWVVQGLLGVAFILAGLGHVASPIDELSAQNPWVTGTMGQFVRFIGAAEVLGGLERIRQPIEWKAVAEAPFSSERRLA